MSVIINTNSAATVASNNLAASNQMLQRSLNRLSSGSKIVNPADDAGGLAVSMKLTAAAKRQGAAATNIGNAVSFLQTQDGALSVAGKVLSRIGELKTLAADPTKNADDIANYQAEFAQLQTQLTSLSGEKFNGKSLFGSTSMSIVTTADGAGTVDLTGVDLLGSGVAGTPINFSFGSSSDNTTFTPTEAGTLTVTSGGIYLHDPNNLTNYAHLVDVGDTATYDGAGGWTFSGTGVTVNGSLASGVTSLYMEGSSYDAYVGAGTFTPAGSGASTDFATVTAATDLASLNINDITGAIQEIATHRANNGAQQSRLGFAAEVLTVNKANIEAANSRISDVDVAQESTQLARYNILVQSGTAMLSQANQSAQMALRLLG